MVDPTQSANPHRAQPYNECVFACNGADALEAADRLDPDVMFLDIGMPGMDGYQVAWLESFSRRIPRRAGGS